MGSSNLVDPLISSDGVSGREHPMVDTRKALLKTVQSQYVLPTMVLEKSDLNLMKPEASPDGSRQSHVNERKPSIGQDCDKENKVVETSPHVKKRFVLRSSQ